MRQRILQAVIAIGLTLGANRASATLIIDHPPHPTGGLDSDSAFFNDFGDPYWQRVADEVLLAQAAVIEHISWHGFYDLDNPPDVETMRIRFLSASAVNGLPDETLVIYEQSIADPSRVETGQLVGTDGQREYRYETDLSAPLGLNANTLYWLEIAQIGDFDTRWRWEFSLTDRNGQAVINPATRDWLHSPSNFVVDTAFQLIGIPEPSSAILFLYIVCLTLARRAPRRMPAG